MIIIQDDREPEMQLLADINSLDIQFERTRLVYGDYIFNNVLVERKTIDDFCSSILDKRIETQIKKMKEQTDKESVVIIIGAVKDRKVNIHEHCVVGKICSLVFKHNIKVIQVDDEFQFLYCLKNLFSKTDIKLKGGKKDDI